MLTRWPFVGRDRELGMITELLQDGAQRGIVLAGDAGVGKTRLVREALDAAMASGLVGHWVVGTGSASAIPFGAVSHLLPPGRRRARDRLEVLQATVGHLTGGPDEPRPVLAIDDAHLLDHASATLVHHLAQRSDAFLIVTVRTGASAPDGIVRLWKDEWTERIELRPLTDPDIDQLLLAALEGQVDGVTRRQFRRAAQGNALYLRELVIGATDAGTLRRDVGVWRLRGVVTPPARLSELIEVRLARLDAQARLALELLAFGEPLGMGALGNLVPLAVLERVERAGLLAVVHRGRRAQVRVMHPMYAAVLRRNAPTVRQPDIYRRLAEALAATGLRREDDALRVAAWSLEAGAHCETDVLLRAARCAMQRFDYELAERLARRAVEEDGGLAASWTLGDALIGRGRSAQAEDVFAALASQCPDDVECARLALRRASNLVFGLGQVQAAQNVIRAALARTNDPVKRGELLALEANCLFWDGHTMEALATARGVIAQDPGGRALLAGLVIGGLTASLCGHTTEALSHVTRGEPLVDEHGHDVPHALLQLRVNRCLALVLCGRLIEAETQARREYDRAVEEGSTDACALWTQWLGHIAAHRGRPASALRWLRESSVLLRERDPFGSLPALLADRARVAAMTGDAATATAALEEAEQVEGNAYLMHLEQARPWVCAATGDRAGAVRLAVAAADRGRERGESGWAMVVVHDIARLGDPAAAAQRIGAIQNEVDGELVGVLASHIGALGRSDGKGLDQASARFEQMGFTLLAAEASCEAAQAYQRAGRTASSLTATARATLLVDHCEGARTPSLHSIDPIPLTARERQIAALAASGLTSRAIADTLVLSVRTVDNHLSSVYAKTGITGRRQLDGIVQQTA